MPPLEEIWRSLGGAWRLCLGDGRGLDQFERSFEAFWRSFFAMVLAAPIYAAFLAADRRLKTQDAGGGGTDAIVPQQTGDAAYYLINGFSYLVDWLALPLAMIFIARILGLSQRYSLYITAYNWSTLILVMIVSPPFILLGLGIVGEGVATLLFMVAMIFALRAQFMVASHALETRWPVAVGLVALQYLMSIVIGQISDQLT